MTVITDALCPFCGCLCDDLTIVVEDNKITDVKTGMQTWLCQDNGAPQDKSADDEER